MAKWKVNAALGRLMNHHPLTLEIEANTEQEANDLVNITYRREIIKTVDENAPILSKYVFWERPVQVK